MIHTLFLTSASATASRSRAAGDFRLSQLLLELLHALALREDARLGGLIGVEDGHGEFVADLRRQPPHQLLRVIVLLVDGQPHAHAELGVVFEQRVRPRRPAPFGVHRVGRRRQVAAVNRRAAGRVGDERAVAEQLGHHFDVRRFAATRAGARELKQRLQQLRVFHLAVRNLVARQFRGSTGSNPSTRCTSRAAAAAAPC